LDISGWLTELGFGRYVGAFVANDVDEPVLRRLTAEDLNELGVVSLGHRVKILSAIAALPLDDLSKETPGRPDSIPTDAPRDAERRQLTVMFVDLVGSTALAARLDPEDMRDVLRSYQDAVTGEITRLGGYTAKLMGDGVLAYFGWPHAQEDSAERAVRAGLGIVALVPRLASSVGEPLSARVGIATGLVVVGDLIGKGASQEQAVVGETPNLAARLQASAEPGTVLIAESTRRLLADVFDIEDQGVLSLKGIPGPTPILVVRGEKQMESRFAAHQGDVVAPIVGRDQELGLLLERWAQAQAGEGQAVLLTGEAGIGKSRVTEALLEAAQEFPHTRVRYQCSPYHAESALYPVIQHWGFAAGFAPADGPDTRLDKLDALLALGGELDRETAALIASLLGLDGDPRYGPLSLTPQQRRTRTLQALLDQLEGLARQRPVLWVVEDAHWIDPTTLELIERALDGVQGSPVMLLVTARPTFVPAFASHPVVTRLALNRLARAATQAIVRRITGGKPLPDVLLDEIGARTDGVPLFVEEMTKAVLESGVLREGTDAFHLSGPLSTLAIPRTLHDSLMARLDRLEPVKEVAQIASVIGRNFDHEMIAALAGMPEERLADALGKLVDAELVFRRGTPPQASYLFKHALVRDAAYESLLKARRVTLHARLLDILERQPGASPEVMAQHAEAAGLNEHAIRHWTAAARRAVARPAFNEAISSFERAITLCRRTGGTTQEKRVEQGLQVELGQALIARHGYQASVTLDAFRRALELADELEDIGLQLPALFGQWAGGHIGATGSAHHARRFAELSQAHADDGARLVGLRMLALETFFEGRFSDSLALTERALESYDPARHRDLASRYGHDPRAAALNYKAWNQWHLGHPQEAARTIESNLRWAHEFNHPNTTGLVLTYGVTLVNIWLGRPDVVEEAAREALALSEKMSLALWHAWGLVHLGWSVGQREPEEGLVHFEAGLREAKAIGAGRLEPYHLALAAEAHARAGHEKEALARMEQAFSGLAAGFQDYLAPELFRLRAELPLRVGSADPGEPEADFRRSIDLAKRMGSPTLVLRAAVPLARLLRRSAPI
jgi:class 3 adenylate cyclase/predicted ATPase